MNADQFCYWLQGFFEISGQKSISIEQTDVIKEHLQLVFDKVTTKTIPPLYKIPNTFIQNDNGGLVTMSPTTPSC